jgi:predicted Zn-dependent peptidase
MFEFKKFVLDNGIRVVVVPQPQSPSVTVAVFVKAGTAYETKSINGISHFLEHMCFKGTQKRPRAIDISSEFEIMGATFNAFTDRDMTGYYAKVAWPNAHKAIDLIADIYLNSLFSPQEIEKEKGVIIEEINMYEDQPQAKAHQILEKIMYGNQPAGWDIAGTKENIKKITRQDFINYRSQHYISQKTIVALAGKISLKEAKEIAQQYFGQVKRGKVIKPKPVVDFQKKPSLAVWTKDSDQSHLAIGFKTMPVYSSKIYILGILSRILGGGMSSRLFQKIREEMGAAYYVGSSSIPYATHGYLKISAGVAHDKVYQVIEAIVNEIKNIVEKGVNQKELDIAKEHKIGTFLTSLETSTDLAFYYGERELLELKIKDPKEVVKKIKSVTKDQVSRLAKQIFKNSSLNFVIVGPYKSTDKFKKILYL